MSDSLRPHGLQHARLPWPSLSPRSLLKFLSIESVMPSISSSVAPFSSFPQSSPASESFPMSQLFPSGGQYIRASASVLPMNIQDWFPLGWTGLISLLSKGLQESSPAPQCPNITLQINYTSIKRKKKEIKSWNRDLPHTKLPQGLVSPRTR